MGIKCELSYSQAKQLKTETQVRIFNFCNDGKHRQDLAVWSCILANKGHRDAQADLAKRYRRGIDPFDEDLVRAYLFNSLVEYEVSKRNVANSMTPEQIAEAERLVAEWRPKSIEREIDAECASHFVD